MGSHQVMLNDTVNGWNEVGDQCGSEFTFPRYTENHLPTVTSPALQCLTALASKDHAEGISAFAEHRVLNVVLGVRLVE